MAVINPKSMRTDHQPVTRFTGRPRQLVDRDALNAAAVTALGLSGADLKVDYVPDVLGQVVVTVFLAHVQSNHAAPQPLNFLSMSASKASTELFLCATEALPCQIELTG